jgi:hypothetical protein
VRLPLIVAALPLSTPASLEHGRAISYTVKFRIHGPVRRDRPRSRPRDDDRW